VAPKAAANMVAVTVMDISCLKGKNDEEELKLFIAFFGRAYHFIIHLAKSYQFDPTNLKIENFLIMKILF